MAGPAAKRVPPAARPRAGGGANTPFSRTAPSERGRVGMVGIELSVNGKKQRVRVPPFRRLIDVLREDLGLTGTKEGCGEGECGACTVLIDGEPVNSCLIPVCQVEGRSVRTVESLGTPEALSGVQQAFLDHGGAQCGICTPGMIISAEALLRQHKKPSDEQIREAIAGNICRCTGYQRIVDAIKHAAELREAAK